MKLKIRTHKDTIAEVRRMTYTTTPDMGTTISHIDPLHRHYCIVTVNKITEWTYIDDGRIYFKKYEVTK